MQSERKYIIGWSFFENQEYPVVSNYQKARGREVLT